MSQAVTAIDYVGSELELFAHARNWKRYFASKVRAHLGADVLEVGAGIGETTRYLNPGDRNRWLCLEPDPQLILQLRQTIADGSIPGYCEARQGTLDDFESDELFDSILYIDVLEHIENDRAELENAARHLKPGGKVIALSPAHQWLFTPFDQSIGHFRRYNKAMVRAITPASLRCVQLRYLDSVGMLASMGNRFLLHSGMPNVKQIKLWDRAMVPFSKVLDPLLGYTVGKSVFAVWEKGSA
ncbi:MAG: class I SAM-dependent methyltransferase [Gemmataceae bacterium]